MKENKYDDPLFFQSYGSMDRSKEGLRAAGEWYLLKAMLPNFKGKRVLDLGCGFGWHCRYAMEQGAEKVLGVDISAKMIERAIDMNSLAGIDYKVGAIEDIDIEPKSFDIVISSLALHYVPGITEVYSKVHRCLSDEGCFVFSAEHPVFTAEGSQQWVRGADGEILHWPVDNYFTEGERKAIFLGHSVAKFHRTLSTYLNGLIEAGFVIADIREAGPDPLLLEKEPKLKHELRRPMMLLVKATKK